MGSGKSPPEIGPYGPVYAIASDILFNFPPPLKASPPLLLGHWWCATKGT
jgi:hypothetical protein